MRAIVVKNKVLPIGPYEAMAIWPFIFTKVELSPEKMNHEKIHLRQQVELALVLFYILYAVNFLWNLIRMRRKPYRDIVFEREAYGNEKNLDYLKGRKNYQWTKYL